MLKNILPTVYGINTMMGEVEMVTLKRIMAVEIPNEVYSGRQCSLSTKIKKVA